MKILFCILASLLSLSTSVCQTGPTSYVLPRTEVVRLPSRIVGIDYLLYVSLPRDYNTTDKKYPLLVTLDADYAFALAHNIVDHFVDRNNLPPMIIVSIAYDSAGTEREVYRRHRTRDYTPTHTLEGGYGPEFQRHSGGAPGFLSFIEKPLFSINCNNSFPTIKCSPMSFLAISSGNLDLVVDIVISSAYRV